MPRTPRVGSIPPYGIKAPVKASTTGNITLSGEQTIDSVSVVAGDRVLVRNQTDTTENGIYNVKNGAWERATDANDAEDIANGTMVLDANSGVVYQLLFSGNFDPGTTTVTVDNTGTAFNLEAKHWAQYPEDSAVPEGDGTEFSALHHSKKSEGFKDKANQWANENEDVEVEPGEFSAFHWAKKSEAFAPDIGTGPDQLPTNADLLNSSSVGNASGDIPISNGTLNTNLNADLLDGRSVDEIVRPTWTSASLLGTGLAVAGGIQALAALNGTDVAHIGRDNDELRTYRWDGSVWSQVGTGLAVSGGGIPALAALNDTDVAFIDQSNVELRTYRWDGSAWAQIGTGLYVGGAEPTLAALNGTDVAHIGSLNEELRTYRWDGNTWAQIGTGLAVAGAGSAALTALNGTDMAFIDQSNAELRTYRWDGNTWAQIGTGLAVSGGGIPALAALNGTDVAHIGRDNDELRTYRWDGSVWSQVGTGLAVSGGGIPALAALNATDVAFIDQSNAELRTYRFGFSIGPGPHALNHSGF